MGEKRRVWFTTIAVNLVLRLLKLVPNKCRLILSTFLWYCAMQWVSWAKSPSPLLPNMHWSVIGASNICQTLFKHLFETLLPKIGLSSVPQTSCILQQSFLCLTCGSTKTTQTHILPEYSGQCRKSPLPQKGKPDPPNWINYWKFSADFPHIEAVFKSYHEQIWKL